VPSTSDVVISVVIPTFNRSAALRDCLLALAREPAEVPFEVILVDDGSTDDTAEVVEGLRSSITAPLRLLRQANQGPAVARNRGVDEARGELIVFLGDDIIVEPGYLDRIRAAYLRHEGELHGIVGNTRYEADSVATPFGSWFEEHAKLQFDYPDVSTEVEVDYRRFYTSNLLVPRSVMVASGGFDPRFRHAAYEDTELGYRLEARGFRLYYAPDVRALHRHPVTLRQTVSRMSAVAQAAGTMRSLNPELFDTLYPDEDARFVHVARGQRLRWWIYSKPACALLDVLDRRFAWRAPTLLYARILEASRHREMSRVTRTPL